MQACSDGEGVILPQTAEKFDWSQFRLGIYVRSRPEEIFALWTTSEGLCRWFLRTAIYAVADQPVKSRPKVELPLFDSLTHRGDDESCRVYDRYFWEWYYDGGLAGEGRILEMRPPTRLIFTFGDKVEVAVQLRKQGELTEIDLRQYNIPLTAHGRREVHMGCRVAWAFFLTNLKSVAEGGLDLRETEHTKVRRLHLVNI